MLKTNIYLLTFINNVYYTINYLRLHDSEHLDRKPHCISVSFSHRQFIHSLRNFLNRNPLLLENTEEILSKAIRIYVLRI